MPEQYDEHQTARDDPEEGGDPQLLQQVESRQELPVVEPAQDDQDDDEAERDQDRALHRPHNARPRHPEELEAIGRAQDADRTQADRAEKDEPLNEGLHERLDVEHEQQVADRPQREGTEDRADRAADPAHQRCPADHDRGDRAQGVGPAAGGAGVARERHGGQEQAGNRGEQPAQHVRGQPRAPDRDAGHVGRRYR